jgi:hypothetical protein
MLLLQTVRIFHTRLQSVVGQNEQAPPRHKPAPRLADRTNRAKRPLCLGRRILKQVADLALEADRQGLHHIQGRVSYPAFDAGNMTEANAGQHMEIGLREIGLFAEPLQILADFNRQGRSHVLSTALNHV